MANISFTLEGDINAGRGALGYTQIASLTIPNTVLWTTFPNKPFRYYLNPSGANNNVVLPAVSTNNSLINTAKPGHSIIIYNTSTTDSLNILNSSLVLVATLVQSSVYTFTASTAPGTWFATNITGGGAASIPLTTKGDLLTRDSTSIVRLPVGANGTFLAADSATTTGLDWKVPPGGGSGRIAYPLMTMEYAAVDTDYISIAYFPWKNSTYSGYTNGTITYYAEISTRLLSVILRDETNNVTLGGDINAAASGVRSFSVVNPASDAKVSLQIKKDIFGGVNPVIFGAVLEYDS